MDVLEHDWVKGMTPDSASNFSTYVPPYLAWDGACLEANTFFLLSVTELYSSGINTHYVAQAGLRLMVSPRIQSLKGYV